jgi:hypothetical protein
MSENTKISKTVFTFTVLHRTDGQPVNLEHAVNESFDGHMVGLETDSVTTSVPDEQVADELVALGNDGEFFLDDLSDEEAHLMPTFSSTYKADPMLRSIAEAVTKFESDHQVDVHTITLILNGQHGEFDLTVLATNNDMEDVTMTGRAHRHGGVSDLCYQQGTTQR